MPVTANVSLGRLADEKEENVEVAFPMLAFPNGVMFSSSCTGTAPFK